ncbi:hypothetical protein [Nonomuraea sp. NPDC050643]|uniref:hypothetical protein n=1 Tax=Nonomuraea sp. NPDC050643 TaxID=3155660 RepID=UPI0033EBB881
MPKMTHVIRGLDDDSPFAGSGIGAYGADDLKKHLAQAEEAGLSVRVYEVTEED